MARLIICIIHNICAYFLSEIGVYYSNATLMPLSHKTENALLKQHLH